MAAMVLLALPLTHDVVADPHITWATRRWRPSCSR
jgi:hypothetical protein